MAISAAVPAKPRWFRDREERAVTADDWLSPTVASRFWSKVDRRGLFDCWLWTGGKSHDGYGKLEVGTLANQRREQAHRIAYVLQVGPIPPGVTVDHLCFNRDCQNASHMELVSRAENGRRGAGRRAPGHWVRGAEQGAAKLTDDLVLAMRRDYRSGRAKLAQLAERHGISQSGAWDALTGHSWRHVAEAIDVRRATAI